MTEQLARFEAAYPGATPGELMCRAIELDEPGLVESLATSPGFDVNAPDVAAGASPLFTALRADRPRLVELIAEVAGVSLAASLPPHDAWGWAESSSLAALKALLAPFPEAAASVDADGATLLHAAVADGRGPEKVDLLLKQPGVEVDARQFDGTTPLYHAALAGNDYAVRRLLERGADVNARNGDNGWTVLMVAAAGDRVEVVAALVQRPELETGARDERGNTALHVAAQRGHDHVVSILATRADIDLDAKDELGRTALMLAAFAGHTGVVRRLLAEPSLDVNLVDRHRQTALHWAALAGHLEIVHALAEDTRTNPAITNRPDGQTAREVAAAAGHQIAVDLLARMPVGRDALSPGDAWEAPATEADPELTHPPIPEERPR